MLQSRKAMSCFETGGRLAGAFRHHQGEWIMSDTGRAAGALIGAVVLGAAAIAGTGWARENGFLPQPSDNAAPVHEETASEPEAPPATPYDLFIAGGEPAPVLLDHIDALCGDASIYGAPEMRLAIAGEAPGTLLIHSIMRGGMPVIQRRSAPADRLHAYGRDGELGIMRADGGFSARAFVLAEDGEPVNSDPLASETVWGTMCIDAPAAAQELNALFAERGARVDPVAAALHAFAAGNEDRPRDALDSMVAACGTGDQSTAVSGRWIIGANIRRDQEWDGMIVHEMSGERPGRVEDFLDLDIAERRETRAWITRYSIPLSEPAFYPLTASGFGPYLNWQAIAVRRFEIWEDGYRSHSLSGDPVAGADIPCHDIAAGEAALRAFGPF